MQSARFCRSFTNAFGLVHRAFVGRQKPWSTAAQAGSPVCGLPNAQAAPAALLRQRPAISSQWLWAGSGISLPFMSFIAPGLVGPFFAAVEMVGTPGGRHSVAVKVLDEGRDDRLVVAGLVGLGPHS